jgi:hypothetical protein
MFTGISGNPALSGVFLHQYPIPEIPAPENGAIEA